jgi:transcriptional regulator with XRE-family HTH domain
MDLKLILDNIDRLLRVKKLSQDKASRDSGHPDAIRNIRRKLKGEIKGKGLSVEIVKDLARVLGVSAAELMEPAERIEVPVVPGLRGALQAQLDYLDRERARVMDQLVALDEAETAGQKRQKRRIR